jgi:hypothetical protein
VSLSPVVAEQKHVCMRCGTVSGSPHIGHEISIRCPCFLAWVSVRTDPLMSLRSVLALRVLLANIFFKVIWGALVGVCSWWCVPSRSILVRRCACGVSKWSGWWFLSLASNFVTSVCVCVCLCGKLLEHGRWANAKFDMSAVVCGD